MREIKNEKLRRLYRTYPDAYCVDVHGQRLTDDQAAILFSLVEHRRTAVKASHGVGKTHCAALAGNWWYDCWDEHICYITAPSWPQALGLTFKYLVRMRRNAGLSGEILESGLVRDPQKDRAGSHYIKAINAETGEGFQGEHSAPILLLFEEAVGVPPYIWEAGDGLMTMPECRMLAICNPTDESTPMGQACSSPIYRTLTICALRHDNVVAELAGLPPHYPLAVRLAWVEEMIEKECVPVPRKEEQSGDAFEFPPGSGIWYLPNAIFQGRVLGEFPSMPDEQVIPRGWLTALPEQSPGIAVEIGCDVARHGTDRTTIAVRSGACVLALDEVRQMDNIAVANALKTAADDYAPRYGCNPQRIPIRIDVTGGLGTGPLDLLRDWEYTPVGVNASSSPRDEENYRNTRSELWFAMRDRVREGGLDLSRLPPDMKQKLIRELSTPKWSPDSRARKVVEEKKDIKKRLHESPDLADALNLAFYGGGGDWTEAAAALQESVPAEDNSAFSGGVW